jgi:hypothetical protein
VTAILVHVQEDGKAAWLCTDGRCTANGDLITDAQPKAFQAGDWAVAASGPCRITNLLKGATQLLADAGSPEEMALRLRKLLQDDGWKGEEGQGPPGFGLRFAFTGKQGAWTCDGQFSVVEVMRGAVLGLGSGGQFAQGAALALLRKGFSPREALSEGIRAAVASDAYCGGEPRALFTAIEEMVQ